MSDSPEKDFYSSLNDTQTSAGTSSPRNQPVKKEELDNELCSSPESPAGYEGTPMNATDEDI
jgi:hypothetical protein